jgi:hypothetical protein
MAKELPYFKFEPAEYLTKDISFCSLSAQGLFINICSYYWQRNCELTKEQLLRRLNHETELNELIQEGVIDLVENKIIIKFLDNQLNEVENKSKTNSTNGSKGGRPKKNPTESETKPNLNPIESESISESKGIREDKIKEDEIKEKDSKANLEIRSLAFKESLIPFKQKYSIDLLKNFYGYWIEPNRSNTKMRFELEKTWSIERRLETWAKRDKDFAPKQQLKTDRL